MTDPLTTLAARVAPPSARATTTVDVPPPEPAPAPEHPHDDSTTPATKSRAHGTDASITWWRGTDLMAAQLPAARWAVPGLVTEGANLLVGPPKVGKSWLALDVALAVAAGGRALGKITVQQGKVALLALEDTPRRLQARARMLLDGQPMSEGLGVAFDAPRLGDGLIEALDATDTGELRLIVLDVLARIRPAPASRNEPIYDRDYAALAAVKDWSDRHGVPAVVVHHSRKAKGDDFLDEVSGSHGLAGAADTILVMRRARNSADATLAVTGRDVEEAEHAMRFDPTRGAWTLLDGPASDYALSPERRRILEAVRATPGLGPKLIAESSNVAYATVKHLVRKMVDDGQLDTDGDGHYLAPVHSVHSVHREAESAGHSGDNAVNAPPSPFTADHRADQAQDHNGERGERSERWTGNPL